VVVVYAVSWSSEPDLVGGSVRQEMAVVRASSDGAARHVGVRDRDGRDCATTESSERGGEAPGAAT